MKEIKKLNGKYNVETGFSENGLPYARMGEKPEILLDIEALSFKHEPPSGFMLKQFINSHRILAEDYTVFLIGRKPNIPEDYSMDQMARDYAELIRKEFKQPISIMGISTGGQISQVLAADHPDTVKKLVIISAAHRLSQKGKDLEKLSAEYFKNKKYGKALALMVDFIMLPGPKKNISVFLTQLFGRMVLGKINYPNDFLAEVKADREMDFKDRLNDIKAPTLILCGDSDIAYTAGDVRETAAGIPGSRLILYPGYGHGLIFKNIKQVYDDMLAFLKE